MNPSLLVCLKVPSGLEWLADTPQIKKDGAVINSL